MIDRYINQTYDHLGRSNVRAKLDITFCLNQEMKWATRHPLIDARIHEQIPCLNENQWGWMQNSDGVLKQVR